MNIRCSAAEPDPTFATPPQLDKLRRQLPVGTLAVLTYGVGVRRGKLPSGKMGLIDVESVALRLPGLVWSLYVRDLGVEEWKYDGAYRAVQGKGAVKIGVAEFRKALQELSVVR